MFNPVFNQDGRVSYFRVTCLAIAIGCFVTGCVMHHETQEVTQVNDTVVSDEVTEVETSDSENFEEIRKLALSQIKNATLYLQTCGELDNTFDNCSFNFTKEFTQYYQVKLDAFAAPQFVPSLYTALISLLYFSPTYKLTVLFLNSILLADFASVKTGATVIAKTTAIKHTTNFFKLFILLTSYSILHLFWCNYQVFLFYFIIEMLEK